MENPSARTISDLLTDAGSAAFGAYHLRDQLDLMQNTEPKIRFDIATLLAAVNHCERVKVDLAQDRETVRSLLERALDSLTLARDMFKPVLGKQFGPKWIALGMPNSLYFPRSAVQIQPIVRCYQTFLENNQSEEVASKQITATYFGALFQELSAARDAVRREELALDLAFIDRDEKAQQLRKRMRDLKAELKMLMDPLDVRWKTFGFNPPGAEATPEVPQAIEAVIVNETTAMIDIPPAPRAEYYRVYQRVVGVDAEPVPIGSPADPNFTAEDLPRHAGIEFSVSALNSGGESARSAPVVVQTAP